MTTLLPGSLSSDSASSLVMQCSLPSIGSLTALPPVATSKCLAVSVRVLPSPSCTETCFCFFLFFCFCLGRLHVCVGHAPPERAAFQERRLPPTYATNT